MKIDMCKCEVKPDGLNLTLSTGREIALDIREALEMIVVMKKMGETPELKKMMSDVKIIHLDGENPTKELFH